MLASTLKTALDSIASIAHSGHMPILQSFHFSEGRVSASNMAVHASHALDWDAPPMAIHAERLRAWLATLPPDSEVRIEQHGKAKAANSIIQLETYPHDDMPIWRSEDITDPAVEVAPSLFKAALPYCPVKDHRRALTGLIVREGAIGATDGKVAFLQSCTTPATPVIMPRTMAEILARQSAPITLAACESEIVAIAGDLEIRARPIEGRYPDIKAVLPQHAAGTIRVNRDALATAMHRASIAADEKTRAATIEAKEGRVEITTASDQYHEAIPAEIEGKPPTIRMNCSLTRMALASIDQPKAELRIATDQSPVLFGPGDATIVVMPVKA